LGRGGNNPHGQENSDSWGREGCLDSSKEEKKKKKGKWLFYSSIQKKEQA
jgi:hypothetical protein